MAALDNGLPPLYTGAKTDDGRKLSDPDLHYAFDRPVSPFQAGQIDGLESLQADKFLNGLGQSPRRRGSSILDLLDIQSSRTPSPADLALSARQYLPYPLMVLNGMKTTVIANEIMERLLGIEDQADNGMSDDGSSALDHVHGQTLSQMGIDLPQDGATVWVAWEVFLDSIADGGMSTEDLRDSESEFGEGDVTPTAEKSAEAAMRQLANNRSTIHDAVVEVIITPAEISAACLPQMLLSLIFSEAKLLF